MTTSTPRRAVFLAFVLSTTLTTAYGDGIKSDPDASVAPAFDITTARASTDGRLTTFAMELAGVAGSVTPKAWGLTPSPPNFGYTPKAKRRCCV